MKNQDFHCSIVAKGNAREAFKNISHVQAWWGTDVEGNTEKLNDIFTIHFGDTRVTFKVTEIIPDKKIVWEVTDSYLPWLKDKIEWTNTRVVWEVFTESDKVKIDMTHVGLVPGIECYENCEKGWTFYVEESLFKLLTEGKGQPDTPRISR